METTQSLTDIQKELDNLTVDHKIIEDCKKIKRAGRPKGVKNRPKNPKNPIYNKNGTLCVDNLIKSDALTYSQKLTLLSQIACAPSSNSSDVIRAIQAHTELAGETKEGFKKVIIAVRQYTEEELEELRKQQDEG